jgi:hypothetical protein
MEHHAASASLRVILGIGLALGGRTLQENWHWQSSFQLGQVNWALGRDLDFCREDSLPDDLGVANALATYGEIRAGTERRAQCPVLL